MKSICTALLITLISTTAAFAMEKGPRTGRAIYSCDLSTAEVIADITSEILTEDPEANVSFEVEATIVKDNKVLVESTEGLPGQSLPSGDALLTATFMIPFSVADFRTNGVFDSAAFDSHVAQILNKSAIRVPDGTTGVNCGGTPTDTVITEHFESCLLGNVTTTYIGSISADGNYYWSITSSSLGSGKAGCYGLLGKIPVR